MIYGILTQDIDISDIKSFSLDSDMFIFNFLYGSKTERDCLHKEQVL